jgi:hypothetical protein
MFNVFSVCTLHEWQVGPGKGEPFTFSELLSAAAGSG